MEITGRHVRAIVVHDGALLGALPVFDVVSPWWSDAEPVVEQTDRRLGARTAVLRMVTTTGRGMRGGEVTYLVEALTPPTTGPRWDPVPGLGGLAPHQNRACWAEPGGPTRLLDWAADRLRALGRPCTGPAVQVKTWNLSCLYRLPTAAGPVWLKCTPDFLGHESRAIGHLADHDPGLVPEVLAADGAAVLLADVRGTDCWETDPATVREVLRRYVAVQAALARQEMAGLPERRNATLAMRAQRLLDPDVTGELDPERRSALETLIADLPRRVAAITATGLPETLVHGDFHSGNWRSDGRRHVVLDWCEAGLGHPARDVLRLAERLPEAMLAPTLAYWAARWRAAVPGADPARAVELMRPVHCLESALTYQRFLDGIEPSERPYHEGDPATEIRDALAHTDP